MPSLQHSITSLQHSRLHEPHLNVSAAHQLYFLYLYRSISRYMFLYMYACICLAYLNVKVWPVYVEKCILFWSKVNFDWHAIFSLQKLQLFVQISKEQKKEKWRSHMCYIIFLFMSLYCRYIKCSVQCNVQCNCCGKIVAVLEHQHQPIYIWKCLLNLYCHAFWKLQLHCFVHDLSYMILVVICRNYCGPVVWAEWNSQKVVVAHHS